MQHFPADEEPRCDLVANAGALLEFTDALLVILAFPLRFERRVISDDETSEAFLQDDFRFETNQAPRRFSARRR